MKIPETPARDVRLPEMGKRGFLHDLLAMATGFGLASTAQASALPDPHHQPPRRPGMSGKRFGMLVELHALLGGEPAAHRPVPHHGAAVRN